MPGFGGFNEKKKKKGKADKKVNTNQSYSSAPTFVAPKVITKDKKNNNW